ncbi:MAG: hypothetical protein V4702_02925 [Patescibacteria group bacterium]
MPRHFGWPDLPPPPDRSDCLPIRAREDVMLALARHTLPPINPELVDHILGHAPCADEFEVISSNPDMHDALRKAEAPDY